MRLLHSGKVRDVYLDGPEDDADVILVASDRLSIYDVVLPTPVPDKGTVITRLSLWWFDRLADLVPHHVISATDVPAEFAGRAIRCRRLSMLPVECIARGYLAGLGLREYEKQGTVSGIALPPGLVEGSKLPEPIFTPTTKAPVGAHAEVLTFGSWRWSVRRRQPGYASSPSPSTSAAPRSRRPQASSSRTPSWSSGSGRAGRSFSATRCSPRTRRGSGLPTDGHRGAAVLLRQAVRPRLVRGARLGLHPARPEVPAEVVDATRARDVEVYERITDTVRES